MRIIAGGALAAVAMAVPMPAQAWDGVKAGKITQIDAAEAENYAIRVYLDRQPICGTPSGTWAYMNKRWSNYEATLSLLMMAWSMNKTVVLYTNSDGNYCRIGYVVIQ